MNVRLSPSSEAQAPNAGICQFDFHDVRLYIVASSPRHQNPVAFKADDDSDTSTTAMRQRLRTQHYLHIVPVAMNMTMSMTIMAKLRDRLIAHEKGNVSLHRWWQQQSQEALFTPSRAVAFWYSNVTGGEDPTGGEAPTNAAEFVPDVFVSGLTSAVRCFERVELLAYQACVREYLRGKVPGLVIVDASDVMEFDAFTQGLAQGIEVRVLADVVRLKHIYHEGGWLIDGDCHWLKRVAKLLAAPPRYGHFFASMTSSNLRKSAEALQMHNEINFLAAPQDAAWIATPFAFPPGSPILDEFLRHWRASSTGMDKTSPQVAMELMRKCVENWGATYSYTVPSTCSPISHLSTKHSVIASKAAPDFCASLAKSLCVNAFFSSSKTSRADVNATLEAGSLAALKPQSRWWCVLKLSGFSLRRIRKKKSVSLMSELLHGGADPMPAQVKAELTGGEAPVVAPHCKRQKLALLQWPKTRFPEQHSNVGTCYSPQVFQSMYELLGQVGKGRYGIVFAGRNVQSSNMVAIKVADTDRAAGEPWLLARCQHPNIVRLQDFFASPFCTMMAMEKWECTAYQFRTSVQLESIQFWKIASGVAAGLAHMHSLKVLHLDLHAANVFIRQVPIESCTSEAETSMIIEACVGDFGNAVIEANRSKPEPWLIHPINARAPEVLFAQHAKLYMRWRSGTSPRHHVQYVMPEELPDAAFTVALDIWAFGCVMYFLCTSRDLVGKTTLLKAQYDYDDEVECAMGIVWCLSEPPAQLVAQFHWNLLAELKQYQKLEKEKLVFIWPDDPLCQSLCRGCCCWDAEKRWTAQGIVAFSEGHRM